MHVCSFPGDANHFRRGKINQLDNLLCFVGNVGIKLSGVGAGFFQLRKREIDIVIFGMR